MVSAQEVRVSAWEQIDTATAYALLRLRVDVFVVEQECAYPELDGRDTEPATRHLWLADASGPTAYLRVLAEPGGGHRIGRVCTRLDVRGQGLAARLVEHAVAASAGAAIVLDAQSHLRAWYERFGFAVGGPAFVEDGIPHVPMTRPAHYGRPMTESTGMPARIASRTLWQDGPRVGAIGLGCMGMSWAYTPAERDDDRSVALIHAAIDAGVTLIDTADVYGPFHNETLVGRALAGRRDEVTLATKVGLVTEGAGHPVWRDGRPEHVRAAVEASLMRLGTDVIDLYQLHRVDEKVPVAETWGAMAELVDAGLVRAIGMSEVDVATLEQAHAIHPVATVQSELSLWTRDPLADVLPWCESHGAGFIPFSPLGRGFLTGTMPTVAADDFRSGLPRFTEQAQAANQAIVEAVRGVAQRLGATPAQVALAWCLAQGERVVPIPGTRRLERLAENTAAAALSLDADTLAVLDALPAPVGARY